MSAPIFAYNENTEEYNQQKAVLIGETGNKVFIEPVTESEPQVVATTHHKWLQLRIMSAERKQRFLKKHCMKSLLQALVMRVQCKTYNGMEVAD